MRVAAALKLVDLRPDVDPLTGVVRESHRRDAHTLGVSPADQAALETALRIAEARGGEVAAVSVGPPAAEAVLREALTVGAARAVRVELPTAGPHGSASSATVAAALASVVGPDGPAPAELVVCGDASLDRGSGAVPAFLAEELGAAQALGLVAVSAAADGAARPGERGELHAVRRLDRGHREVLRVPLPAVMSVEAGTAELRRAPLPALLESTDGRVETALAPAPRTGVSGFPQRAEPFRPGPRPLPGPDPSGDALRRAIAVTTSPAGRPPRRTVAAAPEEAAAELLRYLRETGHLRGG
ncbi:mycofactocin-associated electron transfer flavoprotein beta subunit [Marinitenerispora sediminis]|uniref:Putative mycofactocin-associated electron transfer flavoprotein n=1 Tax=Marinitenerispora sediminis TaxID=1931232 RepID=A0A368SZD6_9ACTN|nr:mycofactocin-associated electron transfer flavoprotein beta subunit [Marinitenerispora sediminis]RCV50930.1 putative mycofactocin-associated electron transfer flavoprotein [Marinitenerispora sediminis]RCV57937.1 putative mycofactocin-associated electron transfer flavoprotein [Marinitenerispora sediminis]RCV62330.1 putative mycofactocin-associated electron transfer flavoprotein [Marinitenerispora sediminis]